jgi:hypothetical protein
MNKKILFGTAILAVLLSGAVAGLTPLTFGFSQSNQQISEAQYYPMHYGPRWRSWSYPYAPYSGYDNYSTYDGNQSYAPSPYGWDQNHNWRTYPQRGYGCSGMFGHWGAPSWQGNPPYGYWNYPN